MSETFIVLSGGFDPLHSGHLDMIDDAAKHGSVIILLNSDEWLKRKKGKAFLPYRERERIMLSLKNVDKVISFNDDDNTVIDGLKRVFNWLSSDQKMVFANGGDRYSSNIPEKDYCDQNNIQMMFDCGGGKTASSSDFLEDWKSIETAERKWGKWRVLEDYKTVKLKELIVKPQHKLSLQRHQNRNEIWFIREGEAKVFLPDNLQYDEDIIYRGSQEYIFIPINQWHQLENPNLREDLRVIEIQFGNKCDEKDIERK